MGLLRLLFRGAKEQAEEYAAKRALEQKLGRKVSKEELYSLGSHLDATQETGADKPLQYTQRESAMPFADAKPPMKTLTKLLLIGIPLLLLVTFGAAAFVSIMPERQRNRLNPFSPKPPAGAFPSQLGDFRLEHKPDYIAPTSYSPLPHFEAEYKNDSHTVRYSLWNYQTEAELNADFEARRKPVAGEKSKVVDNTDTRYAVAALSGWSSYVIFKDGTQLKYLTGYNQKAVLDFEGLLKNAPPLPVVPLNEAELSKPAASDNNLSVTVLQLIDDYKKDTTAADKKYKGKTITVTGSVEVSEKDKKGNWMIGFLRPGSTAPKDGMVVCSFDKSQETSVSKVKKGDAVRLQGRVMMNIIGNVVLEKCSKL
jgi:hypothetical protein